MAQTTLFQLADHVRAMFKFNDSHPTKDSDMLKPATNIDINLAIAAFVNNGKMFTGYDVTKILRNAGFHVMHNDVRDAVNAYQFPYYYSKQTGTVSGMPAVVHYPDHLDAKLYDPKAVAEPNIPVALKKITVNTGSVASHIAFKSGNTQSVSGTGSAHQGIQIQSTRIAGSDVTTDKRGRGNIASRFMRQAGFGNNEQVWVFVSEKDKKITITGITANTLPHGGHTYTTDSHGAVRIAANTFHKAFSHADVVKATVEPYKVTMGL